MTRSVLLVDMEDDIKHSSLLAELLSRNLDEADARDIAAIAEAFPPKSLSEMRSILGEPDRVIEWDASFDKAKSQAERHHRTTVQRWSRVFRYTSRWRTVHLDIVEHTDGTLGMMIGQEKKEDAREQ